MAKPSRAGVGDQEAETLLEGLVCIPSPSGEEAEAAQYFVEWMAGHGFRAEVDDVGNAVGVRGQGPREIVLLGHIDTVPGQLPVRREGRLLRGRGTVDAKGPLAAFAAGASGVAVPEGSRIIVVGAVEEEVPTSRGARYAREQYEPSFCLIGEPSGWDRLTLGYKGCLRMEWSWRGALAHSASPVPTAAERAVAAWGRVEEFVAAMNDGRDRTFDRLSASLQALNTKRDGAYGQAELEVGFRLPPGVDDAEIKASLAAQIGEGRASFMGYEPAAVADKNTALTRAMLAGIREEGGDPRFVLKSGTSDLNVVRPVWDCPLAAYGPGNSRLDHTPEEHIDLDEYLRAIRVVRRTLSSLMSVD